MPGSPLTKNYEQVETFETISIITQYLQGSTSDLLLSQYAQKVLLKLAGAKSTIEVSNIVPVFSIMIMSKTCSSSYQTSLLQRHIVAYEHVCITNICADSLSQLHTVAYDAPFGNRFGGGAFKPHMPREP